MTTAHRQTLRSFPSVTACFAAMDRLHADFKRAHGRNATVGLCYSLVATPIEGSKVTRDAHSVTLHADDLGAQLDEVKWFEAAVQAL